MERQMMQCIEDMQAIADSGKLTLDAQVRAYDLLENIMDIFGDGSLPEGLRAASDSFRAVYEENHSALDVSFDQAALAAEASDRLLPLKEVCNEMRFKAAAAASLHEFAKEVFEIWQTSGVFARRRALKELRERAGFRLESHRIGNYVAKTFDLQNEAEREFARAQQAVFAADAAYKVKPGIYAAIAARLA